VLDCRHPPPGPQPIASPWTESLLLQPLAGTGAQANANAALFLLHKGVSFYNQAQAGARAALLGFTRSIRCMAFGVTMYSSCVWSMLSLSSFLHRRDARAWMSEHG